MEPLDPAVDGPGTAEQNCGDGRPRVAVSQEQQNVSAETDLGIGVLAVSIKQRLALPSVECDASCHGCDFQVLNLSSSTQL
jgi:hypothetical protein